jgi:hypothetical protein
VSQDFGIKPTRTGSGTLAANQSIVNTTGATTSFANTWNASSTLIALEVQTGSSYVTFDGTTPSATNGHQMFLNQAYHWNIATILSAQFKAIGTNGRVMASQFQITPGNTQLPDMGIIKIIPI